MTWKVTAVTAIAVAVLVLGAPAGAEAGNLVTNGNFESLTAGAGQLAYNTEATGWSVPAPNGSYAFAFITGTADTSGANGEYGNVQLWGSNNGGVNTLTAPPLGGNFVGVDGGFQVGALTQSISGLTVGTTYAVSFEWAGAQQSGFTGATQEQWSVSLGDSAAQSTALVSNVNHGFTGWMAESFNFTADNSTETLSFLAFGTPSGVPPFVLLGNVQLNAVPEPSTVLLMGMGIIGIVAVKLRPRSRAATA